MSNYKSISYDNIVQRNIGVYSKKEQEKIRKSKIAIVGIGCDGGLATVILARMGVGFLTLIDHDEYEIVNINRQPMSNLNVIGQSKVEIAKKTVKGINPFIEVMAKIIKLDEDNAIELLKGNDVILQCVDNLPSRVIIHRAAMQLGIPSITMTGQPPFRTFVSSFFTGGPLYEELFDLPYCKGKSFKENPGLFEKINNLKNNRAKYANLHGATQGWMEGYIDGIFGWGITPERAYITGTLQSHEAIRIVLGKIPLAVAPKAIIIDLNNIPNIVSIKEPYNKKYWNYEEF